MIFNEFSSSWLCYLISKVSNCKYCREKMFSNLQEVRAREGYLLGLVTEGDTRIADIADAVIEVPPCAPELAPILCSVPLQQLAYHIAVHRGCDVDQPRNLAKSVTVE